jgi:hypothetical protein
MVIDCDTCVVRGTACANCVVTVLVGNPRRRIELDDAEVRALDLLAEAGLVPPLRLVTQPRPARSRPVPPRVAPPRAA